MKAAVVSSFSDPPRYDDVSEPVPSGTHDMVVRVLAAGLHPHVRAQAGGPLLPADGVLPFVPGTDGVGVGGDGQPRYFFQDGNWPGTMAEQTLIDTWHSIRLPPACDPVKIAAGISPALPAWLALRYQTGFHAGQDILIFGAANGARRMAVQVARLFGAGRIIIAARGGDSSPAEAGVTETVSLDALDLVVDAAADVDIVLDYLWGSPAATAMTLIAAARGNRGKRLAWISMGADAGPAAPLPAAALRGSRLLIAGSGQEAVTTKEVIAELPEIVRSISSGVLSTEVLTVPLADVETAWTDPADEARSVVFVP